MTQGGDNTHNSDREDLNHANSSSANQTRKNRSNMNTTYHSKNALINIREGRKGFMFKKYKSLLTGFRDLENTEMQFKEKVHNENNEKYLDADYPILNSNLDNKYQENKVNL